MDETQIVIQENDTGSYKLVAPDGRTMDFIKVATFSLPEGLFALLKIMNPKEVDMPEDLPDLLVFLVVEEESGCKLVLCEDEKIWLQVYEKLVAQIKEEKESE